MPFVDARRRQQPLAAERGGHNGARGDPGAGARADLAGENDHRHDQQQRYAATWLTGRPIAATARASAAALRHPAPAALSRGESSRGDIMQGPKAAFRACPNRSCVACGFGPNPCRARENPLFFGALDDVIRVGIVGSNYGRTVQLPAFRADPRCEVVALAGSDAARTAELARAADVPKAYGDWRALVEDPDVDAVAIATMPALQARDRAQRALALGKPVFAEKPMASDAR